MTYNVRKEKALWTDEENAYCLECLDQWRNCVGKDDKTKMVTSMQNSGKINPVHDIAWHMDYFDKLTNGELSKGEYAQKDEIYIGIRKK